MKLLLRALSVFGMLIAGLFLLALMYMCLVCLGLVCVLYNWGPLLVMGVIFVGIVVAMAAYDPQVAADIAWRRWRRNR